MLLVPPPDTEDGPMYRISVSLNLNPLLPLSYVTSIHRAGGDDEVLVGEFEFSLNQKRAILTVGDVTARLADAFYSINSSPRHYTWNFENVLLRWDCRTVLEDGSPMCICYDASRSQLASFVPPPVDAAPPLPAAVLTVFPDGHELLDHIVLSALIVQRKLTGPV